MSMLSLYINLLMVDIKRPYSIECFYSTVALEGAQLSNDSLILTI